jgi:hypothetical protein
MNRNFVIATVISVVVSVLPAFFIHHEPGHGGLMGFDMPGLFALFGFAGCSAIILISKFIGHEWLQRPEGYYDRSSDNV